MPMDALRPWLSRTLAAYVLLAVVLGAWGWRLAGGQAAAPVPPDGAVEVPETSTGVRVTIHVAGAVVRPGVYHLPAASRVEDAVRRAGGPAGDASLEHLNLAAPLVDGQQVVVPRPDVDGADAPISLSRASAAELEGLDGIGPTLAGRIVEWRRRSGGFASIDQLAEVSGFGTGRVEALRPHVVP